MLVRFAAVLLLLILCACKTPEEGHSKAILGAVLIDGNGGPPLTDSVVVTAGDRIRSAGPRSAVPVPADADMINGAGKFVVPQPVDLWDGQDSAAIIRPASPAE